MINATYLEEQQQIFFELVSRFQANVVAFQQWEQTYIAQLHRQVRCRHASSSANPPIVRQLPEMTPPLSAQADVRAPSDVTDEQWQRIAVVLPRNKRAGRPGADPRQTLNGILYVLDNHCSWRAIPARYGNNVTCWRRLLQWQNDGTWNVIQRILWNADHLPEKHVMPGKHVRHHAPLPVYAERLP